MMTGLNQATISSIGYTGPIENDQRSIRSMRFTNGQAGMDDTSMKVRQMNGFSQLASIEYSPDRHTSMRATWK